MLVIESYEKLNALLRLLWTVKFDIPPEEGFEFKASPYIAEIYQQTYSATIELLHKENKPKLAQNLEAEMNGDHTFEIKSVEKHIEFLKVKWHNWDLDRKQKYIQLLFSPLVVSEEKINEIIKNHS